MFLCTRTCDTFRVVWEGDPAVKNDEKVDPAWIEEGSADIKSGEKADSIVCRPLNSDEIIRIVNLADKDPAAMVWCASIGVVAIERGDGTTVKDPEEIHAIVNNPQNIESMAALAQTIHAVSTEGLQSLPFRRGGPPGE